LAPSASFDDAVNLEPTVLSGAGVSFFSIILRSWFPSDFGLICLGQMRLMSYDPEIVVL
jgi:hypothetical protein